MVDFREIHEHPFFRPVNWELLKSREIIPPIRPNEAKPLEALNFDKIFTVEPAVDSLEKGIPLTNFSNFTFQESAYLKRAD